jgi:hypothetical protein
MSKMDEVLAKQRRIRELEAMPPSAPPPLTPAERSARDINMIKWIVIVLAFIFVGIPLISWIFLSLIIAANISH